MSERRYPPLVIITAFLTGAVLSTTVLAAGTTTATADPTVTQQVFQVAHIKIEPTKKFGDVEAAFEADLPRLDPAMIKALAAGDKQRVTELEQDQPLFIFSRRDHGRSCRLTAGPATRCNTTSVIRTPPQR